MRRFPALALMVLALLVSTLPAQSPAQVAPCADFDAWQWAQTVYAFDPDANTALDPDGDGTACPELPDEFGGFAPILGTDEGPRGAEVTRLGGELAGHRMRNRSSPPDAPLRQPITIGLDLRAHWHTTCTLEPSPRVASRSDASAPYPPPVMRRRHAHDRHCTG